MRSFYFAITAICMGAFVWSFQCLAETTVASCEKIRQADDLLNCIFSKHPELQASYLRNEISEKQEMTASQWVNPELDYEGVTGNGGTGHEVSLLQTFELGGKRQARIDVARSHSEVSKAESLKKQESVVIETVLNLYRLRQIGTEQTVLHEKKETYEEILARYKKAGALNPEQQISLSVFELALSEVTLNLISLEHEEDKIVSDIQLNTGVALRNFEDLLPPIKTKWPDISVVEVKNSEALMAIGEMNLALAEKSQQTGDAWPNLSIGPKAEFDSATGESRYGLALSLPLPLLNTNRAGKAAGELTVKKTQLQKEYVERKQELEREYLLKVYSQTSSAVKDSLLRSNIRGRHKELHRLMKRGLVSASLVIELHRSILEYYQALHAQETKAIESLWRLYALRGSLLSERIHP